MGTKTVKFSEDGEMQIRKTGTKNQMRGQKGRKKNNGGKRVKQTKAVIAVTVAWKLLDQVSRWTPFGCSLHQSPSPTAENLTANISQSCVSTPMRCQTHITEQGLHNGTLNYPDKKQNIYLELCFKETNIFVKP